MHAELLEAYESGTPGWPAIVFLHGAAVSGRMWSEHMARLATYHCLAPDLPGHGRSNRRPWRSRSEAADLVAQLIESRVPGRRAHVVGLSLGGAITHELLARRADLLDRVIIDGSGVLPWWGNMPFLAGITALTPFLHTRPVGAMLSRSVGRIPDKDRADIRVASRRAFRRSYTDALATRVTRAEIAAPCPTLLVAGEKETAVRRSNAALAALMPHAVAWFVPHTGHGWLGMRLDLHLAMVEAWLGGSSLPEDLVPETISWSETTVERLLGSSAEHAATGRR